MKKVCTHCKADYWHRWRNEPGGNICPDCRDDAVLCAACGAIQRHPPDIAQLALWPSLHVSTRRAPPRGADETYTPPPKFASQSEKRKSPYQ